MSIDKNKNDSLFDTICKREKALTNRPGGLNLSVATGEEALKDRTSLLRLKPTL